MHNQLDIEAYVEGSLTGEELVTFENALKTDETLQREVTDIREFEARMEGLCIRNRVKQALTEHKTGLQIVSNQRVLAVAASFTLLTIAYFWYFQDKQVVDNERFTNNLTNELKQQPHEDEIRYGSSNERTQKEYILEALAVENPNNNVLLKQAFDNLNENKITQTEALFNQLLIESPSFKDEIAYYRALSVLINDTEKGATLLQNIANKQGHKRQEQARKLLLNILLERS